MRCLRTILVLVMGLHLSASLGRSEDKKPQTIPDWGEVVDPTGDCKVLGKAGIVTITVPGTQQNLNPLPGWNNLDAPRVLQDADGDFVIEVKVNKFERPKANTSSNKEKPASFVGGGLVLWQDGKNFVRYLRAANGERGDVFVAVEFHSQGTKSAAGGAKTPDEDTYLRAERKNGKNQPLREPGRKVLGRAPSERRRDHLERQSQSRRGRDQLDDGGNRPRIHRLQALQ